MYAQCTGFNGDRILTNRYSIDGPQADTILMRATELMVGPWYSGPVVFTFTNKRLRLTKPQAKAPINEISRVFRYWEHPAKDYSIAAMMDSGFVIPSSKEVKTKTI